MIFFDFNTSIILLLVIISGFSIYLLKLYLSKSKKKPLNDSTILILFSVCIVYIIILSWFVKIPTFKPYYLYSCYPVRMVPIPKVNETRCADLVLFNLTSELLENRVLNVKPKILYERMRIFNNYIPNNPCLFQQKTIFLYYCMEYGTINDKLYYMLVKN